jgi:hypothetical protein
MENLVINVNLSVNDVNMLLALMGKTTTESNHYPILIKMQQQAQGQINEFNEKMKSNELTT